MAFEISRGREGRQGRPPSRAENALLDRRAGGEGSAELQAAQLGRIKAHSKMMETERKMRATDASTAEGERATIAFAMAAYNFEQAAKEHDRCRLRPWHG